jgi:lipid-A-disaccharide synthase-like uncharacterized protein
MKLYNIWSFVFGFIQLQIVLAVTFWSLIHCELAFIYGMRYEVQLHSFASIYPAESVILAEYIQCGSEILS